MKTIKKYIKWYINALANAYNSEKCYRYYRLY